MFYGVEVSIGAVPKPMADARSFTLDVSGEWASIFGGSGIWFRVILTHGDRVIASRATGWGCTSSPRPGLVAIRLSALDSRGRRNRLLLVRCVMVCALSV